MITYLRQRNPLNYPLLLIYTFLINFSWFFSLPEPDKQSESFFYYLFGNHFHITDEFVAAILSVGLIYITSLFLNAVFSRLKVFNEVNLLPAFIFVTLKAMFPLTAVLTPFYFALIIMFLVVYNLLLLFDMTHAPEHLFFTSFFLGIAGLFYFPVNYYFLFILIAFPVLKRPTLQELFLIPVGGAMPLFFVAFYFYLTDQLNVFHQVFVDVFPGFVVPDFSHYTFTIFPVVFLFVLLTIGFFQDKFAFMAKNVRETRFNTTFTVYFFISGAVFVFLTKLPFSFAVFFLIPVTFFLGSFFMKGNKKFINICLLLMMAVAVFQQFLFIVD
ncbi:MAG TPA: hypothetical protein P5050_02845 [Bacteroidia bacterium]|nr:hypothetical protein [Bacteroidia bacterium]HRS58139.1 hypothetical protein [Bacteroidia bacterium]HRU67469.1 hypothetical protein [Bacteroidia bacterium]